VRLPIITGGNTVAKAALVLVEVSTVADQRDRPRPRRHDGDDEEERVRAQAECRADRGFTILAAMEPIASGRRSSRTL
jgi:hypothetical protein